jgi:glycosyltransferase involved in cell wall biosynthesis
MNLAFLTSSTGYGGLEQNLVRHARWMRERGHAVTVFCVPGSPTAAAAEAELGAEAVRPMRRQRRYFPGPVVREVAPQLAGMEVLWVRDPRDLALAGRAARKAGIACIFQQGMQLPRPRKLPWHRVRYGRVTRWVAPLEHLREEVLRNTPLDPQRVRVIPLGLEDHWYGPLPDAQEARAALNLPAEVRLVGCFGRLDPLKGQHVLIEALVHLPESTHALILGNATVNADDGYAAGLAPRAEALGVAHRVHFRPGMRDVRPAYAALDVFALCSASESIGMVTLEALACGLAVVGTEAGGTPEVLGHGRWGLLVPPDDAEALAQAVEAAQEQERRGEAVAQNARGGVVDRWEALCAEAAAAGR